VKYIRSCPNCSKLVRFPLNKGSLLVKCPYCQNAFPVDPDDPSLYHSGRFDLSAGTKTFEAPITDSTGFFQKLNPFSSNPFQNLPIIKWIILFLFLLLLGLHAWKLMNQNYENSPPKLNPHPPAEDSGEDDSGIDT
jgi:phage FluMu protein Com